jgi:hypothetical protein
MEEQHHPIPQQISAYQFRLVGDMTLKQFFQVAGGALVSLLFYSSGLPGLIKWPLIIVSFFIGVALAFFPLEDRPLEKWVVSFFKNVYSPTIFFWQKTKGAPVFFQEEVPAEVKPKPSVPTRKKEVITSEPVYIQPPGQPSEGPAAVPTSTLPEQISSALSKLEETEKAFLANVTELFRSKKLAVPIPEKAEPEAEGKPEEKTKKPILPYVTPATIQIKTETAVKRKTREETEEEPEIKLETHAVAPVIAEEETASKQMAAFTPKAAPPLPPTRANTVVGQVMDADGKIVEGAILEIKDASGRPVRAFKTNKLGHFMIATPLLKGNYEIITEKEGLEFEPVAFKASGEIIPPMAIWAKKAKGDEDYETN